MKKRWVAILMTASLAMGTLLSGCGNAGDSTGSADSGAGQTGDQTEGEAQKTDSGEVTELTFFHYYEQYADQFDRLKELYKEVQPNVDLKVEIIGADYDMVFSTRAATGEVPDIFMSGPFSKNETFLAYSYMLNDEPFMSDVNPCVEYLSAEGDSTAVPFTCQAWGILYNKDVFEKAEIAKLPETLEELEAVCIQLQNAGYTPFVQGYNSSYIIGQLFGFPWAMDENIEENIAKVLSGETELGDLEVIHKIMDCVEVVKKYTQENPYNDDFAAAGAKLGSGEGAMFISGDWIVENALKANPDARIGIMALPVSDNPDDALIYACNSTGLCVNKESKNLDAALEFLNWLVTSEEAKKWLSEDVKALSAIKGVTPVDSVVLADASEYINEGKSATWGSYFWPDGLEAELRPVYDKYLLDEMNKDEAIAEMGKIWKNFEE